MKRKNVYMRTFVDSKERSPEYENAVSALRKLFETNPGLAGVAYSEAAAPYHQRWIEEKYGKRVGVTRTPAGKFLGIKGSPELYEASEIGGKRGADHVRIYRNKGEKFGTVTSEPYGMTLNDMRALTQFCDTNNLDCLVDTGSTHFASSCLLIVLQRKKDVPVFTSTPCAMLPPF